MLLLAYLALGGPKPKRYVAELFWPEAQNKMNSLAVALKQLRQASPELANNDESHVWTEIASDIQEFKEALQRQDYALAVGLYQGPFAEGYDFELGIELEEWLYESREDLARHAQSTYLQLGELAATVGRLCQSC
ncbi:MAG: hypothetical protein R2880_15770 [Deinococcales bacterium]